LNSKTTARSRHRTTITLLIGVVILYVVVYSLLSVARYNTFHATTFDLGIMAQVVWNTAHGRWFETSLDRAINVELIGSYMGNHVRPFLLLLSPFYRLWPDPRLLLVLQSIALGGAAIPLYCVTQRRAGNPRSAFVVAGCYLVYPALGFLNLFDFHPIAFSIPCVFIAYWALLEERMGPFWIAVLLALSTKEEMVVPIGTWGLVSLFQREKRRVGLGLFALAVGWAGLCFGFIIPHYNDGQPYRFWEMWSSLFDSSAQLAVQGGAANLALGTISDTAILFLLHLALPLGFLPFLGPASLAVALPSLAYLLVGKRPAFHSVGYQYPAVLIPWFFLAVVEGLARVRWIDRWLRRQRIYRAGLAFLLIGTVGTNIVLNPVLLYARAGAFRPDPYHSQIVDAMSYIPSDANVVTVNRLGPALVNRRVLVTLEYPAPFRLDYVEQAEYVLLDLVDCRTVPALDQRARYAEMVAQVLQTGLFRVRYWSGRILLLEKGMPSEKELAAVWAYVDALVEQNRPCWP
jgi:uncharacterized membrane protein